MRKRLLQTLMIAALIGGLFTTSAYAETAVLVGGDVNLRSGPGMGYEVLGCFPEGTYVTVNDRSDAQWYSVTVEGNQGFMSSHYLRLDGQEEVTSDDGSAAKGYINGMFVNVRTAASTDASIISCYNQGTELTITGTEGEWTAVQIGGDRGYVLSQYVSRGEPTPQATPAPAYDDGTNAVLVKDDVYLFCEPSFDSDVKGVFNQGVRLIVNEVNGDWMTVSIYGFPGYVYRENVSRDNEPAATPAPTIAPTPAPSATEAPLQATPAPAVDDGTNAVLVKDDVYLFCEPSFDSDVKGVFNQGVRLIVNEVNGDWMTVSIYGFPGYVYRENVSRDNEPAATPAPTIAPTPAPSATEAPLQATPAPAVDDGTNAVLVKDDVYLFSEPSFYSDVKGVFNQGVRLIVNEENGDWLTVSIYGFPGYVYRENVSRDDEPTPTAAPTPTPTPTPTAAPTPQSGYVNVDHVHLRSGPSTSSEILAVYDKNARLTITGTTGDWVAVSIQGNDGYIYKDYVTADATPTPTPAPTATPAPSAAEDGYIKGNHVRMRAEPSMSGEVIGEYNSGKKLTITGTSGDWTAVSIDGKTGYIYSSYVARGEITVPPELPDSADEGTRMAQFALQFVGYPYVWAGKTPEGGFDCSGLVYYVFHTTYGYNMYRVANDQMANGVHVDHDQLQPGDLLGFYSGGGYVGHVGIYIGDGKFVHASNSTTGVIVSDLDGYYTARGFEARRIAGTDKNGPGV